MLENQLIGDQNLKYKEASDFLSKLDPDWEALIKKKGIFSPSLNNDLEPYQSLIKSVIFQQVHPKAGNAIFKRFLLKFNNVWVGADPDCNLIGGIYAQGTYNYFLCGINFGVFVR